MPKNFPGIGSDDILVFPSATGYRDIIRIHDNVFVGLTNSIRNIPHIHTECGQYFVEYRQFHKTILWINKML